MTDRSRASEEEIAKATEMLAEAGNLTRADAERFVREADRKFGFLPPVTGPTEPLTEKFTVTPRTPGVKRKVDPEHWHDLPYGD